MNPLTQSLSGGEVTQWCLCGAAVIWIVRNGVGLINEVKKFGKAKHDESAEFVTQLEFRRHEDATNIKLAALDHSVQTLTIKIAEQPMNVRNAVDTAIDPMKRKVNAIMISQAAICQSLGIQLPGD